MGECIITRRGGNVVDGEVPRATGSNKTAISIPDLVGKKHFVWFSMESPEGSNGVNTINVYHLEHHNGVYMARCYDDYNNDYVATNPVDISNNVTLDADGTLSLIGKVTIYDKEYTLYFSYGASKYVAW